MKKNVLALSIAAMIGELGFAFTVHACEMGRPRGTPVRVRFRGESDGIEIWPWVQVPQEVTAHEGALVLPSCTIPIQVTAGKMTP